MATVINNPGDGGGSSSNLGSIVGIIAIVILVALFIFYALPALRNRGDEGTNINVPDQIDVNINRDQQ